MIVSFSTPPHAKPRPVPVGNPIGLATEAQSRNLLFFAGRLQLGLVGVVGLFRSRASTEITAKRLRLLRAKIMSCPGATTMRRRDLITLMGGAVVWPSTARAQSDATKLAPKGELRAALIVSNPVLVTRRADGQLGGVSVELARAFATKLSVPIRLMPYENPARYNESLGKDEWDNGLPPAILHGANISPLATSSWKLTTAMLRGPDSH